MDALTSRKKAIMKRIAIALLFASMLTLTSAHAQTPTSTWVRGEYTDALTETNSVEYSFATKQADGRTPYIYMLCYPGNPKKTTANYYADTSVFYDPAYVYPEAALTLIQIRYRDDKGNVRHSMEQLPWLHPTHFTLSDNILRAFGKTGHIVISFNAADGTNKVDEFQQAGVTQAVADQLARDCSAK